MLPRKVALPRPPRYVYSVRFYSCTNLHVQALRLDALGNIINADSPLMDLVHENIVVKKFVYDNDVEPEVPVVKSTRSRSKKAKS
jgi:hypothetical protein